MIWLEVSAGFSYLIMIGVGMAAVEFFFDIDDPDLHPGILFGGLLWPLTFVLILVGLCYKAARGPVERRKIRRKAVKELEGGS